MLQVGSEEDCGGLVRLVARVGSSGDGWRHPVVYSLYSSCRYRGSPLDTGTDNPHTAREELRGVTVGKLALLVLYGLLDWRELEAVLGQAERVQQHTQVFSTIRTKTMNSLQLNSLPD